MICDLLHNLSNWNVYDLLQFSTYPNNTKFHQLKHLRTDDASQPVEVLCTTPHIYEQKDCTNNGYVTDMLEHNTMINIDTGVHMISYITQT